MRNYIVTKPWRLCQQRKSILKSSLSHTKILIIVHKLQYEKSYYKNLNKNFYTNKSLYDRHVLSSNCSTLGINNESRMNSNRRPISYSTSLSSKDRLRHFTSRENFQLKLSSSFLLLLDDTIYFINNESTTTKNFMSARLKNSSVS